MIVVSHAGKDRGYEETPQQPSRRLDRPVDAQQQAFLPDRKKTVHALIDAVQECAGRTTRSCSSGCVIRVWR